LIANDQVVWGKDHTTGIRRKLVLIEESVGVPAPSFAAERDTATKHLRDVLGEQRFPNPKPVDVLMRWLRIMAPRDAVVLDFFGGSGTTMEAVMRLNEQDGGSRSCLLVTNNEVSSTEALRLRKAGVRPGDPEWEKVGVCEFVAQPRIATVTSGTRVDGSKYSDGLAQNVEFFRLTYEAPLRIASHRDFERIAPVLWLRAGARGRRIDELTKGWDVAEAYGVLADLDQVEVFVQAVAEQDGLEVAFIVTDEGRSFETVVRDLPDHIEPVRLYEAYLRNFEIESGRGLR
jgi:adenine-specific DNA-methyltransferase